MTAENLERAAPLAARKLPRWEELPDLDLYMDQVLSLIHRYLGREESPDGKVLTSSMVNNYVKMRLMPAPEKKKYSRVHLAYLIAICVLKTSLPMAAVRDLLQQAVAEREESVLYNEFCDLYEDTGRRVLEERAGDGLSRSSVINNVLTSATTGRTVVCHMSVFSAADGDGREFFCSLAYGLHKSSPLCTDSGRVRSIFHIYPREDPSVFRKQRRRHMKMRIGHVSSVKILQRPFCQLLYHIPVPFHVFLLIGLSALLFPSQALPPGLFPAWMPRMQGISPHPPAY